jgi:hypothetical protein
MGHVWITNINMKKIRLITKFLLVAFIISGTIFSFEIATAASLKMYVTSQTDSVRTGDTILLNIYAQSDQEINVAEGVLVVSNPADIVSISTGGSIMSLWPKSPTVEGRRINFIGGTPSAVFGKSLKLFTVAIKPSTTNPIRINFEKVNANLNDGKGTRVFGTGTPFEIKVLAGADGSSSKSIQNNELSSLVSQDNTDPEPFTIEIGRDSKLYNGKYFITFFATDLDSGIDYYEVTEEGFPTIRPDGNIYVLHNQNLDKKVKVKVFDHAGNSRVETFGGKPTPLWVRILGAVLLVGVVGTAIYRFFLRKNK